MFLRLLLLTLALLASPALQAAEDYAAALELYQAKKSSEAIKILRTLAKSDSERSRAFLLMGTMAYERKRYKTALKYFDRADPDQLSRETAFAFGATYLEFEQYQKAMRGFRLAIKLKSGRREEARYKLAVCAFKLGQLSRAERMFSKVKVSKLPSGLRVERQRYLQEVRQRQEELITSFFGNESDVRSVNTTLGRLDEQEEWNTGPPESSNWELRWRPGAMIRQESFQSKNMSKGRDTADNLSHKLGVRAFAGGDSQASVFGSLDFYLGLAGYQTRLTSSRSYHLVGSTGNFFSEEIKEVKEENFLLSFKPLVNFVLSPSLKADAGASGHIFLPGGSTSDAWGQTELVSSIRTDGEGYDAGFELALQQPFDGVQKKTTTDLMLKGDWNTLVFDSNLRASLQTWSAGNSAYRNFDRYRFGFLDNRFRYHVGFQGENRFGLSLSRAFGDVGGRVAFDLVRRSSSSVVERLNPIDDPETSAESVSSFSMGLSFPLWDTISITSSYAMQDLGGYHFLERDPTRLDVIQTLETGVVQNHFQLGAVIAFVDWIKVRLNYGRTALTYKSLEAAQNDAFRQSNPGSTETSTMFIEFNKSF